MESFISRKRKRDPSSHITENATPGILPMPKGAFATITNDDEDSTDIKIAILASLHPGFPQEELLNSLISHNGSVADASANLSGLLASSLSSRRKSRPSGLQSSLPYITVGGNLARPKPLPPQTRKGKTLHLFSPADIAAHTPCSVIHNFLPNEQAESLLKELLPEAPTFPRAKFKLFDNVVQSPHSAAFYVNNLEDQRKQKAEYLYNGTYLSDVREILPEMRKISVKVEEAVNEEVAIRIRDHYPGAKKLRYQCPDRWVPNAAFVNCYDGGAESVGWHSDQLSYLGPRAVIGSLSLGVAREFRVRKIVGRDGEEARSIGKDEVSAERSRADQEGQIAIHLPHNSFLVMHAEMQEEWKHSISSAQTVEPHSLAGNKRLNITYRWYRESFRPCYTPRCRCGIATVLKCVQKKKENRGRYMWMCQAGGIPDRQSCGFFEWAEFTDDGEPVWKRPRPEKHKT